jgi:xanthine dehydrogenase/oxidase
MYNEDDVTPYGQRLTKCNIRRCWAECLELAKYETRQEEIEQFNKINKYTKRGIYMMPTMLGIGFAEHKLLNQVDALLVYVQFFNL